MTKINNPFSKINIHLARAEDIIGNGEMGVNELARELKLNVSYVHKILHSSQNTKLFQLPNKKWAVKGTLETLWPGDENKELREEIQEAIDNNDIRRLSDWTFQLKELAEIYKRKHQALSLELQRRKYQDN